jgi:hypothetical protein
MRSRYLATITVNDIGESGIRTPDGHYHHLASTLGRIQRGDVGKRVFIGRDNAGVADVYQVESDSQLQARTAREQS